MVACTADKPRTNLNWWFGHGAFCLQGRAIRVPLRTWLSSATGPTDGRATTSKPGKWLVSLGAWRLQKSRPPSPFCPFAAGHAFCWRENLWFTGASGPLAPGR